jgi:hypothetical protein
MEFLVAVAVVEVLTLEMAVRFPAWVEQAGAAVGKIEALMLVLPTLGEAVVAVGT